MSTYYRFKRFKYRLLVTEEMLQKKQGSVLLCLMQSSGSSCLHDSDINFNSPKNYFIIIACGETSSLAQAVEQWTGNPKVAGSIPAERQFFRIACF